MVRLGTTGGGWNNRPPLGTRPPWRNECGAGTESHFFRHVNISLNKVKHMQAKNSGPKIFRRTQRITEFTLIFVLAYPFRLESLFHTNVTTASALSPVSFHTNYAV